MTTNLYCIFFLEDTHISHQYVHQLSGRRRAIGFMALTPLPLALSCTQKNVITRMLNVSLNLTYTNTSKNFILYDCVCLITKSNAIKKKLETNLVTRVPRTINRSSLRFFSLLRS